MKEMEKHCDAIEFESIKQKLTRKMAAYKRGNGEMEGGAL